jgi:prepilin-type N-terminal cleavage/methylation domain-containing protein
MARPRHAFTLVELVLVMATIAILAGIAAPKYASSLANYRSILASRQFAADLGAAQAIACATSTSQTVAITQPTSSYTVTALRKLDNRAGTYSVNLSSSPYYASINSATLPAAVTAGQIVFDGYGTPNTGATVIISSGGRTHTVTLDAASGAVTVN